MTTEIAVANQLGIALATDSAVTITSGSRRKVFNSADKLFELSGTFPVAVMVNGNMDCLGTPWEILVKEFRAKEGATPRGSIEKWAADFIAYVENNDPDAEDAEGGYIDKAISAEIRSVQELILFVVKQYVYEASRGSGHILTQGDLNIRKVLDLVIGIREKTLAEIDVSPTLKDVGPQALKEKYGARIEKHITDAFIGQELLEEERSKLVALVIDALLHSVESSTATGIVVAGYGADDLFPAIWSAEIDGRVTGKLKVSYEKFTPLADCADGGMVTSFAQTDVIERLLRGADSRFVERSADFIQRAVTDSMQKGFDATEKKKLTKKALGEREKLVQEMAAAARDEFTGDAAEAIKENFSREFDQMIAMMPKQELIELAEALVSITAIERKATVDEGTVGGPVDVALITKHEGFVWIKRKHHFPKDLNPRYFWRRFGQHAQGSV